MRKFTTKLHLAIMLLPLEYIVLSLLITIYVISQALYNYYEYSLFMPFQIAECYNSENSD